MTEEKRAKHQAIRMAHIYPTTIEYESRIINMTDALASREDVAHIGVFGFPGPHLETTSRMNNKATVYRVGSLPKSSERVFGKILRFLSWYVSVFSEVKNFSPDYVSCHSISVLPVSWLIAKCCAIPLIYEPHELETETITMFGWRKKLAKVIEGSLVKSAECVIAVSQSIAERYATDYSLDTVHVIRNCPKRQNCNMEVKHPELSFRHKYRIKSDDIIFLYQGALAPGRGVDIVLEAFKFAKHGRHIVFMGFGPLEGLVKEAAKHNKNIHFHPPVPSTDLPGYTVGADVGIAFLDRSCLNHEFALPNKIFQYLHAGKPVLTTNLVEMSKLVQEHEVGWLSEPEFVSMRDVIDSIDQRSVMRLRCNVPALLDEVNWQNEEKLLHTIYDNLFEISLN